MKNQPVLERFFDKVVIDEQSGCWNFTSSIGKSNCGRFYHNHKQWDAYRIGYILLGGVIPLNYDLHHVCENRLCVNPEHLMPVSKREHHTELSPTHIAYKNKRKTHCPSGHPYTEDNLKPFTKGRHCLTCARKRSRECSRKKKERDRRNGLTKDSRLKWTAGQILEMQTSKLPRKELMAKFGISASRLSAIILHPETVRPITNKINRLKPESSLHLMKDPHLIRAVVTALPLKTYSTSTQG